MAVDVTVVSNLPEVATRIEAGARVIGPAALRGMVIATEELAHSAVEIISEHTPVVSGALQDSTTAENHIYGLSAIIDISQPAEADDGFPYVWAVVEGRAAIEAPSSGPWSTGASALKTPWGYRKSVGPSDPNPYPGDAAPEIEDAAAAIMNEMGLKAMSVVVETMMGG